MESTIEMYKSDFLQMDKAEYFSGLRPVCADDVPIIGKFLQKMHRETFLNENNANQTKYEIINKYVTSSHEKSKQKIF